MSKRGLTHLVETVTGLSIGPEDPVEEVTPGGSHLEQPPTLPNMGAKVRSPSIPLARSSSGAINEDLVESKAEERFHKELPGILASSTPQYAAFLAAQQELSELLADTLSGEALQQAVVKGALKKAKLTLAQVHEAIEAMRAQRRELKRKFDSDCAQTRKQRIDDLNQKIQQSEQEIRDLDEQIAGLQKKISDLKASIQPNREGIAAAEQKLALAMTIDEAAGQKLDAYLNQLEQDLLNKLPK